jgi:hypothetical protein
MAGLTINGVSHEAEPGERLVDAINRFGANKLQAGTYAAMLLFAVASPRWVRGDGFAA